MDSNELKDLAQKHITAAINRYRTELLAEIDTNIETSLLEFKDHVIHRSWLAAQKWCRWTNEKFVLFPDYTRIYYRKGNREVLVQENPPQVRVMSFQKRLAVCKNSEESAHYESWEEGTNTYSLALPYIVFIFSFDNGKFSDVYMGFSDRPLKNCYEPIIRPYLPNIDSTLKICLGRDLNRDKLITGNITQQVAYILSHFWQTTYRDEWSAHYWNNKAHFEMCDQRLATLAAWQQASIDNSLFVIEDVPWLMYEGINVGDVIQRIFENEPIDSRFGQEVYDKMCQTFQDTIRKMIVDQFDLKMEHLYPHLALNLTTELTTELATELATSMLQKLDTSDYVVQLKDKSRFLLVKELATLMLQQINDFGA